MKTKPQILTVSSIAKLLGSLGGKARAKRLSRNRRLQIAIQASLAAKEARKRNKKKRGKS